MSVDTCSLIKQCITEKRIKHYEYNEFSEIEEIGSDLVGKVYKANWRRGEKCFALKSFSLDSATVKEIAYEVSN